MGELRILPPSLANMIAAGEVVQRPSSVVKELVENAVDAGADSIDVTVTDAGRTLIQVIDNGCGMSPEDASLCFESHATSKISSPEDLEAIMSYGFRGEALASIAAIAHIVLRTRRAGDETAAQVTVSDFGRRESSQVAAPVGTSVAVRDLFYNTPARRKFLKSDAVELKHIISEFSHVALTHPEVEFRLKSQGRDVMVLKKAKSLKFRIMDILGASLASDLVDVKADTSAVRVSGFVGKPEAARKTVPNQYFFVNGRYFRSPYFNKAVMRAYEGLVPEGVCPPYVLCLEVDPAAVDVNIHPTKTEIKFEEDSVIFQTLYACVKEAVGRNAFGASIDFESGREADLPLPGAGFLAYREEGAAPAVAVDPNYDPFRPQPSDREPFRQQDFTALFESAATVSARDVLVVGGGKFILTPSSGGVLCVNARRARERIFYEDAVKALAEDIRVAQKMLFPVQVRVGAENVALFGEHSKELASLGFEIAVFGTDTVVVSGVPEGYAAGEAEVNRMVNDLILVLEDDGSALPDLMLNSLARRFAVLSASACTPPAGQDEARSLLERLFSCKESDLTAGGKKISHVITVEELERKQ